MIVKLSVLLLIGLIWEQFWTWFIPVFYEEQLYMIVLIPLMIGGPIVLISWSMGDLKDLRKEIKKFIYKLP